MNSKTLGAALLCVTMSGPTQASEVKDFFKNMKDKAVEAAQKAAGQTQPAATPTEPAAPATPVEAAPSTEPISSTSGPATKKPAAAPAGDVKAAAGKGGAVKGTRTLATKLKPDHVHSVRGGGNAGTAVASPDGKHIALVREVGSRYVVELDGVVSQQWDGIGFFTDATDREVAGKLLFSPDSGRLAYVAREGEKVVLVMGDQKVQIEARDFNRAGNLTFSSANRYAMVVRKPGEKAWVVVDGVTHGPYGDVRELQFSGDGKHVAWLVQTNAYANNAGGLQYMVDGKPLQMHARTGGFRFNRDGSRHVYFFNEVDKNNLSTGVRLVTDGKAETTRYQSITDLQISPDGKTIGFVGVPTADGVNPSGSPRVVINGKAGKAYEAISAFTLSPDGSRHAYRALVNVNAGTRRALYVADGKESKDYDDLSAGRIVYFTPDSKRVASTILRTFWSTVRNIRVRAWDRARLFASGVPVPCWRTAPRKTTTSCGCS